MHLLEKGDLISQTRKILSSTLPYLLDRAFHSSSDTRAPVRAEADTRNQKDSNQLCREWRRPFSIIRVIVRSFRCANFANRLRNNVHRLGDRGIDCHNDKLILESQNSQATENQGLQRTFKVESYISKAITALAIYMRSKSRPRRLIKFLKCIAGRGKGESQGELRWSQAPETLRRAQTRNRKRGNVPSDLGTAKGPIR